MVRGLKNLVLILTLCCVAWPLHAQEKEASPLEILLNDVRNIEKDLETGRSDIYALGKILKRLTSYRANATECATEYQQKVTEKRAALEALGARQKKESPEVVSQRRQQQDELTQAEKDLAACNAVALRIQAALEDADRQLQTQLARQLLAHGDNIFDVIARLNEVPVNWYRRTLDYSRQHGWIQNAPARQIWTIVLVTVVGVIVGMLLRRFLSPVVFRVRWSKEQGGRFIASLLGSFCHDAPYLLASIAMATTMYVYTQGITPTPIISALAFGLCYLFVIYYVIHFSLAPHKPGSLFLNIKPDTATALARRLKVLTIIMLIGYLLVNTLIGASLPNHAMSLVRSIVRIAFAINLIWILWLFGDLRGILKQPWLRYGLSVVILVAVLADLSGYTNLAGWLLRSVFGSLFVIVVILILGSLTSELLEGLEYGRTSWQRRMRRFMGFTPEGHITGFFWFRLLVNLGWWSLLILLLILIWDLSASVVEEIRVLFTNGFTIGSLKVVPARIVFALVSLGVLVALSAWFQGQMRKRWVSKMPMDRGARESMVTVIGYLGVTIAILVTLGIAGIDYANLAIIAGALSLGIGFGLQNIVNNFVSGLILLFERPVKTGDWVIVGNTEGYVRSIRIRATQIETFDRADVIVPNSELISGQVTNWMLRDPRGRARIPIGVAYGSDTQKVKEILLKVACEHPQVINDGGAPEPTVLFRQFGESSLDFELRVYIRNIDQRLNVISDLNFAIDAAFREHGIEIPFPQRDLHIKNWPGRGLADE